LRPTVSAAPTGTPYRFFQVDGQGAGFGNSYLRLNRITLQNGYAVQTGGGAILGVFGGQVSLNRSQLNGNAVFSTTNLQQLGGGVYIYQGVLEVFSSVMTNNRIYGTVSGRSVDGGSIAVIDSSATVKNTLFTGNTSDRYGNIIYVQGSGSPEVVTGSCLIVTAVANVIDVYGNSGPPPLGVTPTPNPIVASQIAPAPVDASGNWWGVSTGPRGTPYASGGGASINNGVLVTSYRTTTPTPGCGTPSPTPPAIANLALVNIANGTSTQIVAISNMTTPTAQPVGGSVTPVVQANATMLGTGGGVSFDIVGTQSSSNFDTVPPYQSLPLSRGRSVVVVAPYYEPNTVATPGATRVVYVNIATLTPSACNTNTNDVLAISQPTKFRIQPSLDEENWLFELPTGTLPLPISNIPNRPWLWPTPMPTTSLQITNINLIARVAPITWVDPNVQWYQAVLTGVVDGTTPQSWTGYIQQTNTAATPMWSSFCTSPTALGTPMRATSMPPAPALATFASVPPIAILFDGNQPPAVMGNCGIHFPTCGVDPDGSTIDVVPRNIELCIDTRSLPVANCDPGYSVTPDPSLNPNPTQVPVFAPRGGCASYIAAQNTLQIRLDVASSQADCTNFTVANGNRLIALTHVTNFLNLQPGQRLFILAGVRVGDLCPNANATVCGVLPNASTHLAFQLQVAQGSGYASPPGEVLPYLAFSKCLYDDWAYRQNTPQPQSMPIRACP